jgi:hypothetical protein
MPKMNATQVAEVAAALPLAEAVCRVLQLACDEEQLTELFDQHRGRGYERIITFPQLVRLIGDVLLQEGGSGYRVFSQAREAGELEASLTAVYGKLSRLSLPLSMAFLSERTAPLQAVFPDRARRQPPKSLRGLTTVILDGKAIKRVAKRLKPLRGIPGGLLGGRALVAMDYATGLAVALHAEADGDANDARFVPELLPVVRARLGGGRLWLADRGFCDLNRLADFTAEGDHFLIRFHPKNSFHPDPQRRAGQGRDAAGRSYREEWGWLGAVTHKQRRYVRRIGLSRPGEEDVILVTDLLSAADYPAVELLEHYLQRWGIERVFQQVTEIFGLEGLIGGTPQATVFQFSFCLLIYNAMQTLRGFVAAAQRRETETISLENLFRDVRDELTAYVVLERRGLVSLPDLEPAHRNRIRHRLRQLLADPWSDYWLKAGNKNPRRPAPRPKNRAHNSVYRILQAAKPRP